MLPRLPALLGTWLALLFRLKDPSRGLPLEKDWPRQVCRLRLLRDLFRLRNHAIQPVRTPESRKRSEEVVVDRLPPLRAGQYTTEDRIVCTLKQKLGRHLMTLKPRLRLRPWLRLRQRLRPRPRRPPLKLLDLHRRIFSSRLRKLCNRQNLCDWMNRRRPRRDILLQVPYLCRDLVQRIHHQQRRVHRQLLRILLRHLVLQ